MIAFLDFDGVLHDVDVIVDRTPDGKRFPAMRGPGELMQWASILETTFSLHPEVQIVLSTKWVWWFGLEFCRSALPPALAAKVIGATWEGGENMPEGWIHWPRHRQCRFHAEKLGLRETEWFAIDDDSTGLASDDRRNFVITAPWLGVSEARALKEIEGKLTGSKPLSEAQLAETIAWLDRANKNMKRMATDEAYRLEIAKKLS